MGDAERNPSLASAGSQAPAWELYNEAPASPPGMSGVKDCICAGVIKEEAGASKAGVPKPELGNQRNHEMGAPLFFASGPSSAFIWFYIY
jgi:hypothetical protein